MPAEAAEVLTPTEPDSAQFGGPLEARLTSEQIAQLDQMNADAFGGGQETSPSPGAGEGQDVAREMPTSPPPTTPAKETAPPSPTAAIDEFTPPEEDGVTAPPPETPVVEPELPEGKSLFPDEAIDKLRTEKAKGDIKGLREHYEKARTLLTERETELNNLRKQTGAPDAETSKLIEDLKARNQQLTTIVEQKAIRDLPWFQENFTQPRQALVSVAEKALDLAGIEEPRKHLEKAMGLNGRERIAALDQLFEAIESPTLKTKLENSIAQIEVLDDKESAFLADREGNTEKMLAAQRAQQHEQMVRQEQFVKEGLQRTVDFLSDKNAFFRKSGKPGYEKWDSRLEEDRKVMEELSLRNDDPMKLISVVALGVRTPAILTAYERRGTIINELRKEISDLRGVRPSVNGDRVSSGQSQERPSINPNEDLAAAGMREIDEIASGAY